MILCLGWLWVGNLGLNVNSKILCFGWMVFFWDINININSNSLNINTNILCFGWMVFFWAGYLSQLMV